jgi:microcystin degradation protein MlrC
MTAGARVAIGGIWHETNTFAAEPTGLAEFQSYQFAEGDDLIVRYRPTRTELGGMIAEGGTAGFELVPTIYAAAVPAGIIRQEVYEALADKLTARLRAAGALDGVLLTLHGAAVAERTHAVDADLLGRVRGVVGRDVPVLATFDLHANIGPEMAAAADVLIGYDTFPHVDMFERGAESVRLLQHIRQSGRRPARALCKVPLLTVPQKQPTGAEPLKGLFARLHAMEEQGRILTGSIAPGFPYADVPQLGATVLAYADSRDEARRAAEELARALWAERAAFEPQLTPLPEAMAVANAYDDDAGPLVLVDPADNVGGGSPGDSTHLLKALLEAGVRGAVLVLWDPEEAEQAAKAGVGGRFAGLVGGKTDDWHGAPVAIEALVTFAQPASYRHEGSYMQGFTTDMGLTAVLETGGNRIVVTSLRTMPFDPGQLRCVGIEPAAQRILVVKSALAWQAAFGPMARRIIVADTPGACSSNLKHFRYTRCPRPIYPLDLDTDFEAHRLEIENGAIHHEA